MLAQLKIPGFGNPINNPIPQSHIGQFSDLGTVISSFLNVFFYIAGFLMLVWAFWGVFRYIFAGGNKENLAKARAQITWAIVGFLIFVIAFAISDVIKKILGPSSPPVTPLSFQTFQLISSVLAAPPNTNLADNFGLAPKSLGEFLGRVVGPAITVAGLAILFYLLYGGFKYLTSGGDKEAVAQARGAITHAIIGFLLLLFLFLIVQFLLGFFGLGIKLVN